MTAPIDLIALFEAFSEIGKKNGTGLDRLALSEVDAAGRSRFSSAIRENRLNLYHDAIGNQFGLVQPFDGSVPLVLVGSHLDSQPDGGRFDGQVGVLAALSAVCGLRDCGALPENVNLGVVNWTNEEGARFQPSVMGSSFFTGRLALADCLAATDNRGISVADALRDLEIEETSEFGGRVAGYAELHVEQGAVLEEKGIQIGIVDGTWAAYKADVSVRGVQTHTGPTPMARRVDALYAAARAIVVVHDLGTDEDLPDLHTAVAWMRIVPNSPNATPSRVDFKVELRSPDEDRLRRAREELTGKLAVIEHESGVAFDVGLWSERHAEPFDEPLVAAAEHAIRRSGLSTRRMMTIAGHDAVVMNSAGVPTVLLFVPSHDGITHNAAEFTPDADLINGERALTCAILEVCRRAAG